MPASPRVDVLLGYWLEIMTEHSPNAGTYRIAEFSFDTSQQRDRFDGSHYGNDGSLTVNGSQ